MTAARLLLVPVAAGAVLLLHPGARAAGLEVEPYKLVRSLQRIQDEIADGDKTALGMQIELSKLVDKGFRGLSSEEFADPKTARALISYSMLGGNPQTLEAHLADIGEPDSELVHLGLAVLSYQKGASQNAAARLKDVDPMRIGGMFGASLALIRGLITEDDAKASGDFDIARLLAPGTLIEEAALRRLMSIHRRQEDPAAFLRVASRYARRFVASPYALQYAQEFTSGVLAMSELIDVGEVVDIIEFLPQPYREALTLRLLHAATLEGKTDIVGRIAGFAPDHMEMADHSGEPDPIEDDVHQKFYTQIARVTSENVDEVADELRKIDVNALSESERNLLSAVLAVADAVTQPVVGIPAEAPVQQASAHKSILHEAPAAQSDPVLNDFEDFVGGTRSTLESVDKLLEEIR